MDQQENNWRFEGNVVTDEMFKDTDYVGFVYKMTAVIDGKLCFYIGKKNLYSNTKVKLGKKEMPTDKRLKTYKRVSKLNYKNYYSSNVKLKEFKAQGGYIRREILEFATSNSQLTYLECMYLFSLRVLEREQYLNDNILGKFYRGKV